MTDQDDISACLRVLAQAVAEQVSQDYRLDRAEAVRRVLEVWSHDTALRESIAASAGDLSRVIRTRVYKDAVSKARKRIYFSLRRYAPDKEAFDNAVTQLEALAPGERSEQWQTAMDLIVRNHASTAERLSHFEVFLTEILGALEGAHTVLDIGAGVMPLLFPFERVPTLDRYVACDRDATAVRAVTAYARWRKDNRLTAILWDLSTGWQPIVAATGIRQFDAALMLKLVPVISRQQPAFLSTLGSVPAARIVVTGSKEALAKRQSIARREQSTIEKFLRASGYDVAGKFETPDEIGFVARTGVEY